MTTALWMTAACMAVAALSGCASLGGSDSHTDGAEPMTLVYLKTGPTSATNTPAQKQEIFAGHMANMSRLADEGVLVIAGPFSKPRDTSWRGILLLTAPGLEQAREIGGTDPGVSSGEFGMEVRRVLAPAAVRQVARLEKELQAELKAQGVAEQQLGQPPPSLRAYVMVHAEDFRRAYRALKGSPSSPGVIWHASFRDSKAGVIALDALTTDDAARALGGLDVGPHGLDAWWSTKALERLALESR